MSVNTKKLNPLILVPVLLHVTVGISFWSQSVNLQSTRLYKISIPWCPSLNSDIVNQLHTPLLWLNWHSGPSEMLIKINRGGGSKIHSRSYEGPEEIQLYPLTSALDKVSGQCTSHLLYPWDRDPIPIAQEVAWAPRLVLHGCGKSHPHWNSTPNCPAHEISR